MFGYMVANVCTSAHAQLTFTSLQVYYYRDGYKTTRCLYTPSIFFLFLCLNNLELYCVVNCCRWALFPPHTPKEMLKVPATLGGKQRDEAISWFAHVYPQTQLPTWPQDYKPVSGQYILLLVYTVLACRCLCVEVVKLQLSKMFIFCSGSLICYTV